MALKISISGFRGTIGGDNENNFTPVRIVEFTTGYARFIKEGFKNQKCKVVLGRDGRISGEMVSQIVSGTLMSMGIDVIDLGLSTTPTVEIAVPFFEAHGGIILTASHNPIEWNALKLLDKNGEFIDAIAADKVVELSAAKDNIYNSVYELGNYTEEKDFIQKHIDAVMKLPLVNKNIIADCKFSIVVDAVNSTGGIAIPEMLKALGVEDIIVLNGTPDGHFAHNPEPLQHNLTELSDAVVKNKADLGIAVDPDVDRLSLVNEDGSMFGEEYTLVAVADYVLSKTKGNTVSNLSSTRALKDITEKHGCSYNAAAVGEVNVVNTMKNTNAIIGGEGNGGIIYPELHYGRDALVGVALFLSLLAERKTTMTNLKSQYPAYFMGKHRIDLKPDTNPEEVVKHIEKIYKDFPSNKVDGLKIDFQDGWIHIRQSNTERIIRVYSESVSEAQAEDIATKVVKQATEFIESNFLLN